jgi:hypothetical protein
MSKVKKLEEIIFIFIGSTLPKYAVASLELAQRFSGLKPRLIANHHLRNMLRDDSCFTAIEDFYDPENFFDASRRISMDHNFRNGFWLKSLERFFVLEQYMENRNLSSALHAELDQLLFDVETLSEHLAVINRLGLFFPFHTNNSAVASIFFCNQRLELTNFIEFCRSTATAPHEMRLLASWANNPGSKVHRLPTLASELHWTDSEVKKFSISQVSSAEVGGIVDAAQLGQWIGGIDPRNVGVLQRPRTRYIDKPQPMLLGEPRLAETKFLLSENDNSLWCESTEQQFQLYNLHLHSKIHPWLVKDRNNLRKLFHISNKGKSFVVPGNTWIQRSSYFSNQIQFLREHPEKILSLIKRKFNRLARRRPSSFPLVSIDTFRNFCDFELVNLSQPIRLVGNSTKPNIFCKGNQISELVDFVEKHRNQEFNLVVDICIDAEIDSNYESLVKLGAMKNIKVYAVGLNRNVPGIEFLPLGIENLAHGNYRISDFELPAQEFLKIRKLQILWWLPQEENQTDEIEMIKVLSGNRNTFGTGWLSSTQTRDALSEYAFVCITPKQIVRNPLVWAAMYMGCIPIMKDSYFASQLERLRLPIWRIGSFEDLTDIGEEELRKEYSRIQKLASRDPLFARYWFDKINSK